MRSATLALCTAALLAACSPFSPPCENSPLPFPGAGTSDVIVDDDATPVDVSLSRSIGACVEGTFIEAAEVEVLDPLNRRVEHTLHFTPSSATNPTAHAQLRFVAPTSGYYHITVTYSPIGGSDQKDLLILHDRSMAQIRSLPSTCKWLYRTDNELLLCGPSALAPDGGLYGFGSDNEALVAKGNVAWGIDRFSDQVRRYEATADRMRPEPDAGLFFADIVEALLPSKADELIIISDNHLNLVRVDGGALQLVDRAVHGSLSSNLTGVVYGQWLYVAESVSNGTAESTGFDSRICSYRITPTGLGRPDAGGGICSRFFGEALGANADGIWTWGEGNKTLRLIAPEAPDGGLVVLESLGLPRTFELSDTFRGVHHAVRPTFTHPSPNGLVIPRREGARIVLDHFPAVRSTAAFAQDDLIWIPDGVGARFWSSKE